MKIELTEAEMDGDERQSIHRTHDELFVRVLSSDPLGPSDWTALNLKAQLPDWAAEKYQTIPCGFDVDIWAEDDPDRERYGFEQYWFLPIRSN